MEAKRHLRFFFHENKQVLSTEGVHTLLERSTKIYTNDSNIRISFSPILCSLIGGDKSIGISLLKRGHVYFGKHGDCFVGTALLFLLS